MTDNTNETLGEEPTSWLHQFEATVKGSLPAIEKVVREGLTEAENQILVDFSSSLIKLATVHNSGALLDVVLPLLSEIEQDLIIQFSAELIKVAQSRDPEALSKITALL